MIKPVSQLFIRRRERRLSREKVAKVIGHSARTLIRWENEECLPDLLSALKLARFYGVKVDDLAALFSIAPETIDQPTAD